LSFEKQYSTGGLRCLALLACGIPEPRKETQALNGHMYLGAQADVG
jgi:hypothetical protein